MTGCTADVFFRILYLFFFITVTSHTIAQSVGINTIDPHPSAALDIKSDTSGILIPTMDSTHRKAIMSPEPGLMVYDTSTFSFWYFQDTAWRNLSAPNMVQDTDGDTKIWMEKNPDEDWMRFDLGGVEKMFLARNSYNHPLLYLRSPSLNTSVGSFAGVSLTGDPGVSPTSGAANSFFGNRAGQSTTSGFQNTFIGTSAGRDNVAGYFNTFIGSASGFKGDTTWSNTFVGENTGYWNQGHSNTFLGARAGINNREGASNIYIGSGAANQVREGDYNIISGTDAAIFMDTSDYNTIIGGLAGQLLQRGNNNVYLGFQAGAFDTLGNDNTMIGSYTGQNVNGDRNVFIGINAGTNANGDDQLIIENSSTSTPLIYGDFSENELGINWDTTLVMTSAFNVNGKAFKTDGNGNWLFSSDKRLKKDIKPIDGDVILEQLDQLTGVTYHWNENKINHGKSSEKQYGFIAQDIQKVWPEKVKEERNGYLAASYGDFDPMIIEAIKRLNQKVNQLEKENRLLSDRYEKLMHLLEQNLIGQK